MRFMLSCIEVTRLIASDEFAEAGWLKRIGLRFHLLMCRCCRRYQKQLSALGAGARDRWGDSPKDPHTLERLERQILEQSGERFDAERSGEK